MTIEYLLKNWENIDINNEELNNLNWKDISSYQILSEEFIDKYQNKIDWDYIAENKNLSPLLRKGYYINKYSFLTKYLKYRNEYILTTNSIYRIHII